MSKTFIIFLIGFVLGAIVHERDMERNCKTYGNAKAWFADISCPK